MDFLDVGRIIMGLVLLIVGGELLVRGASVLARRVGISSLVVGLTVVAAATSAPELAVTIGAVWQDEPGLAVGNVVGSNVANLGLIDTKLSLVIAYCSVAVPFCTWMLRGYFDTIPRDLDEAAALDGLGPFATFWHVVLPLARPGLAVTAFYTFLTAWGEVAYAIAFTLSDSKLTLGAGLQQFVPQYNPQWDLLTAGAVLIMVPASLVFYFAQKHLVAGLTAGGTKG